MSDRNRTINLPPITLKPGDSLQFSSTFNAGDLKKRKADYQRKMAADFNTAFGGKTFSVFPAESIDPVEMRGIDDHALTVAASDSHAGDHLPPSNPYSDHAKKMMGQEARAEAYSGARWGDVWLRFESGRVYVNDIHADDDVVTFYGPMPTKQEEAHTMYLYSVILVAACGKIAIDTKVVAKTEEAAKLAAGVYGWLQEQGRALDEVTVYVRAVCGVRDPA